MPIVVLTPPDNQPFGIGLTGEFQLDPTLFVDNDYLDLELRTAGETYRIVGFGRSPQLHAPQTTVTLGEIQTLQTPVWQTYPQFSESAHGKPAVLQLIHKKQDGTIVEQQPHPVTIDQLTGWQIALPKIIQAQTGGGYTEADRSIAQASLNAVRAVFPAGLVGVADVIMDIGQLFTSPPAAVLRRAETLLLTGRGTLRYPPGGSEVQAYGAHLSSLSYPPGAGARDGVILEFEVRVAQFAVYGRHGTVTNYVQNLADWSSAGQYFKWGGPFPVRIEYDITPGFTLGWTWLILGVQS